MSYGSDNLRVACLDDEKGKNIKRECLFFNLYDHWTLLQAEFKSLFNWYHPKIRILEKQIRKKLEDSKDLPSANVFLQKLKEKDKYFCPVNYLNDKENYLEKMKRWKKDFKSVYIERNLHLKLKCWPISHKNIYRHKKLVF